jgi:opacity protein-like surface antigen
MRHTALLSGVVLLAVGTSPAQADPEEAGWRIGAGGTFSKYDQSGAAGISDTSMGFKAYGQYRFNDWFGFETAWAYTGEFEEDTTPGEAGGTAKFSGKGPVFSAIGYLPWGPEDVTFYLRTGFYRLDQELELDGSTASRKADGLTAGAGTQIAVAEHLSLRVEGDWYDLDGADLWTATLGFNYHFGARP